MTTATSEMAAACMAAFSADDGETIHVEVSGSGRPVVLLHGWTADHHEWQLFRQALGEEHRLYAWDARGHGGHQLQTTTAPTLERMARDLAQLLAHFDLADATLVGHSMGVLTIWEYLRQQGAARVRNLCLIDQSPKLLTDADWQWGIYGDFDVGRAACFAADLRQEFVETVLRLSAHGLNQRARAGFENNSRGWQRERERLGRLAPAPLIAAWNSLVQADYRALLPTIELPVLLIYGEQSNFYDAPVAHYVHERLRQSTLYVYENTDHCPHLWQPQRFLRDFAAFADDQA